MQYNLSKFTSSIFKPFRNRIMCIIKTKINTIRISVKPYLFNFKPVFIRGTCILIKTGLINLSLSSLNYKHTFKSVLHHLTTKYTSKNRLINLLVIDGPYLYTNDPIVNYFVLIFHSGLSTITPFSFTLILDVIPKIFVWKIIWFILFLENRSLLKKQRLFYSNLFSFF